MILIIEDYGDYVKVVREKEESGTFATYNSTKEAKEYIEAHKAPEGSFLRVVNI